MKNLDWMGKNMATELNTAYEDKKLVKNEVAANRWKVFIEKMERSKEDY
jgi:hypothetical protein